MKKSVVFYIAILFCVSSYAQDTKTSMEKDTTKLNEVIVLGRRKLSNHRQQKTLSSIDEYLERSNRITMIKRGNYAWEPTVNNMNSERLNVTIDGMQIFGACTDKMDPITSYVDVSNLEQVAVGSGQSGTENGHCVGGGIDLQLPPSKFYESGLKTSADLGFETNGNYRTAGLDLDYSGSAFHISTDGIFRKSDNYDAGDGTEVMFSQFQKYNISFQSGYKLSENHSFDANVIYDRATDVGYPALPMDVSLAEALITSLSHNYSNDSTFIKTLESKVYFNTITHIMDDSKRPDVPIRMDMPGWSDTYGFYSKATASLNKHQLLFNLNGYYNRSLAEMTMFPNDPDQAEMFMLTWPDVRTLYTGIFAKNVYVLNTQETLTGSLRLGFQHNKVASDMGLESLQIFYPNMSDDNTRVLTSISSEYSIRKPSYDITFGVGYGERAPSVSEGYGFFLFNSFDNYDYIGNPNLDNERSLEANTKVNYHTETFHIGLEASYFHLMDYIIGDIDLSINSMTIGANGVRVYKALDHARIFDIYLNSSYVLSESFSVNGTIGYNYGKGSNGQNLPLIRPLSYLAELNYNSKTFNGALQLEGNGNQGRYSGFYGEDETPAYGILNLNFGHVFYGNQNKFVLKYGVQNVLDAKYSTYADWNNIPRQGRNFYINLSCVLY